MKKSFRDLVEYALEQDMEVRVEHENSAFLFILDWSSKKKDIFKAIKKQPKALLLFRTAKEHHSVGWASINANKHDEKSFIIYAEYTDNHPLYTRKGFIDNWFWDLPNERI